MYNIITFSIHDAQSFEKIKEYSDVLAGLINECFGYDYDKDSINRFLEKCKYAFIAFDGSEPIGSAYIKIENIYKYNEIKKTYIYVDAPYDRTSETLELYPVISGLCRKQNDKYKGVGTMILKEIFTFFDNINKKENGNDIVEYVYLIPESVEGKGSVSDNYCGKISKYLDESTNEYLLSNKRLIRYYKSLGFEILDKYYFMDVCNHEGDHVHYNIMMKKLSEN
jgi:hypothetical protein